MRRLRVALPALTALLLGAACRSGPEVTRIVDGRSIDGHHVSPDAYSAYLDGTLRAEGGDDRGAATSFETALAEDPASGEVWARLGAALCLLAPARADAALVRAMEIAPELDEPWLARARCALRRGDPSGAAASAQRAVALSPASVEATSTVVEALERLGDTARATVWRRALAVRAGERGGPARPLPGPNGTGGHPSGVLVDRALADGDAPAAHADAARARRTTVALAVQAIEVGQPGLALEIVGPTVAADPGSTDARIVALAAADLARDERAFARLLTPLAEARTRPTPSTARLMEELLARRAGPAAARAWARGSAASE